MRFDQHPGRNCANGDTEAWFPPRNDIRANRAATALCNGCPVITECLEFALGGARAHRRRGESPCLPCLMAERATDKRSVA